jgi:hypothetical protein
MLSQKFLDQNEENKKNETFEICDENNNSKNDYDKRGKTKNGKDYLSTPLTSNSKSPRRIQSRSSKLTDITNVKQSNGDIAKTTDFVEWSSNDDDISDETFFSLENLHRYKNSIKMQTYLNSSGAYVSGFTLSHTILM